MELGLFLGFIFGYVDRRCYLLGDKIKKEVWEEDYKFKFGYEWRFLFLCVDKVCF